MPPTTTDRPKALFTPFELKEHDDDARTFTGLASTWDMDLGGDVIHRGAFKRTLAHWRKSKKALPLMDQHNYGSVRAVVGKMVAAEESDAGLEATFEVIDGPDGDEIYRRVKGGFVDGLSIGYRAVKTEEPSDEERLQGVWRHLKEVKLEEVSVVIWPMNPGARIDSVKSLLTDFRARLEAEDLTDEDRAELKALHDDIGALLQGPAPEGLAPEDPRRIAAEAKVRDLTLRRLGTRHGRLATRGVAPDTQPTNAR